MSRRNRRGATASAGAAELLATGLAHHQTGRLSEADAFYRRALALEPDHAETLHLRGIVAHQMNRHDLAVELIGRAIERNGGDPVYFFNFGNALASHGRLDEAAAAYRRALFLARLEQRGVGAERVELVAWLADSAAHLKLYDRVDIALDPFPYNGTTTTCEALWMGVPVVTLLGDRHAARVGASLLTQIGLTDWIGRSIDEYIEIALALAGKPGLLSELRRSLRPRLLASPLCDAAAFARGLEAAFRRMWQAWCEGPSVDSSEQRSGIGATALAAEPGQRSGCIREERRASQIHRTSLEESREWEIDALCRAVAPIGDRRIVGWFCRLDTAL